MIENLTLSRIVNELRRRVQNARDGLPDELFYFVSELTPLVNVDLLINNEDGQTLLTWRADAYYGPGWHVPGGIIRFKEYARDRIRAVACAELSATVRAGDHPLVVREVMAPDRDVRGHFISLLYSCRLLAPPNPKTKCTGGAPTHGQWMWHDGCPINIIRQHEMYRPFINGIRNDPSVANTDL